MSRITILRRAKRGCPAVSSRFRSRSCVRVQSTNRLLCPWESARGKCSMVRSSMSSSSNAHLVERFCRTSSDCPLRVTGCLCRANSHPLARECSSSSSNSTDRQPKTTLASPSIDLGGKVVNPKNGADQTPSREDVSWTRHNFHGRITRSSLGLPLNDTSRTRTPLLCRWCFPSGIGTSPINLIGL